MNTHHHPMPAHARHFITSVYERATEEDAVRVVEVVNSTVRLDLTMWGLPEWPGVEETHHKRDVALACALAYFDAEWPDTSHMNTTMYYTDAHGTWCVECGNSVVTAEDGCGCVCSNPSCQNYDAVRCPTWVKELHSVA